MGGNRTGGKILLELASATATHYLNFDQLGLSPILFEWGWFKLRWYSLAYIVGIFAGYFLLKRMVRLPGAPMAERHIDDLLFWAMLGVIGGGRIGYVLFYNFAEYRAHPIDIFKLWDGGMSFHGGVLGVTLAIWYVTRRDKLSFLRVCDYVACVVPIGMLLGRLANFVNGELWGRVTDVPWAIIFPAAPTLDPRHPSQLYEAGLEGLLMLVLMSTLFWGTKLRYRPGFLVGVFATGMGLSRFIVEFFREPDSQLLQFAHDTGLSMGQWLTIPLILLGLYLMFTAKGRRHRVESFAGTDSVA